MSGYSPTKAWFYRAGWTLGVYLPPDRRVLNREILPYYASAPGFMRVLFVGVKSYNKVHADLFHGREFVTIEPNPLLAEFGAKRHHVDVVQNICRYEAPGSFDAIFMNGILGFGVDTDSAVTDVVLASREALRMDGHLVFGVNEEVESHPKLASCDAMKHFEPHSIPPLGGSRLRLPSPFREKSHTFCAFRRTS